MKILFLHPPWPGPGYGMRSQNRWPRKRGDRSARYPILLCYTATLLKKNGYDVKYIDSVMQNLDNERTSDRIRRTNPDIIFIETATSAYNYDKLFIDLLKKNFPKIKILLAGSHVTYFPEQALKETNADIIIKGEHDYITLNVVNAIKNNKSLKSIKGICYKDGKKIINNPTAPLIQNLDKLPFPDRNLIPHQWYVEGHAKKTPFTFVMSARGCPMNCSFCLWPNIYYNHTIRYRSIKNVVDEIGWLIKKYGIKEIFFDDDTFNTSKERVIEISKEIIKRNINIIWSCSTRVDIVDEEMLYWMKRSGCKLICYGGESASLETLRRTNKDITLEQIKKAADLTKKSGIRTHFNFIVGFPWENRKDIQGTIDFALKLKPDTVQFSLCFPHPGSRMYIDSIKNNWFYKEILDGKWEYFDMIHGPVLKTKIPREELNHIISKAHAKFFLRPSYILSQLFNIKDFDDLKVLIRGAKSVIGGKIIFNSI